MNTSPVTSTRCSPRESLDPLNFNSDSEKPTKTKEESWSLQVSYNLVSGYYHQSQDSSSKYIKAKTFEITLNVLNACTNQIVADEIYTSGDVLQLIKSAEELSENESQLREYQAILSRHKNKLLQKIEKLAPKVPKLPIKEGTIPPTMHAGRKHPLIPKESKHQSILDIVDIKKLTKEQLFLVNSCVAAEKLEALAKEIGKIADKSKFLSSENYDFANKWIKEDSKRLDIKFTALLERKKYKNQEIRKQQQKIEKQHQEIREQQRELYLLDESIQQGLKDLGNLCQELIESTAKTKAEFDKMIRESSAKTKAMCDETKAEFDEMILDLKKETSKSEESEAKHFKRNSESNLKFDNTYIEDLFFLIHHSFINRLDKDTLCQKSERESISEQYEKLFGDKETARKKEFDELLAQEQVLIEQVEKDCKTCENTKKFILNRLETLKNLEDAKEKAKQFTECSRDWNQLEQDYEYLGDIKNKDICSLHTKQEALLEKQENEVKEISSQLEFKSFSIKEETSTIQLPEKETSISASEEKEVLPPKKEVSISSEEETDPSSESLSSESTEEKSDESEECSAEDTAIFAATERLENTESLTEEDPNISEGTSEEELSPAFDHSSISIQEKEEEASTSSLDSSEDSSEEMEAEHFSFSLQEEILLTDGENSTEETSESEEASIIEEEPETPIFETSKEKESGYFQIFRGWNHSFFSLFHHLYLLGFNFFKKIW